MKSINLKIYDCKMFLVFSRANEICCIPCPLTIELWNKIWTPRFSYDVTKKSKEKISHILTKINIFNHMNRILGKGGITTIQPRRSFLSWSLRIKYNGKNLFWERKGMSVATFTCSALSAFMWFKFKRGIWWSRV